ncbi:unnamed protein product [Heligmosomoides polygyrus]|uniref:Peptidase_M13_N domain-containing protein n=1 Tax=Heligmosomoides polygyrus TaxID=6339 RepID=A0A3P7XJ53_HELPZ|nr:unnamed protein product [Heligmosomoides polygyrus]
MSKLLSFTVGASCLSVAVAIALLVFNVLIYIRVNDDETHHNKQHYVAPLPDPPKASLPGIHSKPRPRAVFVEIEPRAVSVMELAAVRQNSTIFCSSYGDPDPMWQFVRATGPQAVPSKLEQAQLEVYSAIKRALDSVKIDDESASKTERITKKSCVGHQRSPAHGYELQILTDMKNWFGGLPYLNHTLKDDLDVFGVIGALEQERALGTFMRAWVAPDNKHVVRNALYLSQPELPMSREYYVEPQFYAQLEDRADMIRGLLAEFTIVILQNPQDHLEDVQRAALDVVKLETEIATASLPESEMRNYEELYNPYTLEELKKTYPFIGWESYIANLLSSVENGTDVAFRQIILTTPSYFAWLNTVAAKDYTNAFVNYMILHILFDEASFFRLNLPTIQGTANFDQQYYSTIDSGVAPDEAYCLHTLRVLMPYGPGHITIGYVYAKSLPNRNETLTEIEENVDLISENFVACIGSSGSPLFSLPRSDTPPRKKRAASGLDRVRAEHSKNLSPTLNNTLVRLFERYLSKFKVPSN